MFYDVENKAAASTGPPPPTTADWAHRDRTRLRENGGNLIYPPRLFQRFRAALHTAAAIEIAGPLQHVDGVIHVRVRHLAPLALRGELPEGRNYR